MVSFSSWIAFTACSRAAFAIRDGADWNANATTTPRLPSPPTPPSSEEPSERSVSSEWAKPHFESTATNWDEPLTPGPTNAIVPTSTPDDIGSIIATWFLPTVRFENTATGFRDHGNEDQKTSQGREPTPTSIAEHQWQPAESDMSRFESTAKGFGEGKISAQPEITPAPTTLPKVTQYGPTLSPVQRTKVIVQGQTLTPEGDTVTIGQGDEATKVHLDRSGAPVMEVDGRTSTQVIKPAETVIDGQTLKSGGQPITVGSGFQVSVISINEAGKTVAVVDGVSSTLAAPATQAFTIGDVTATAEPGDYEYVDGSSTLRIGYPIIVDGTEIVMTTDEAGSTLIVAGDDSTTLPALATPAPTVRVSTTVMDGTSKYIIESQTLAPDHPITVDGTKIDISTSADSTVLVVGDRSTTLGQAASQSGPREDARLTRTTESAAATTGSDNDKNRDGNSPATTASDKDSGSAGVKTWSSSLIAALLVLGLD